MNHDVFVSYSSEDKAIADAVVAALEQQNIRCWYAPRDIEPGADWGESITNAIQASKIVLLIFSGSSNQSKRVLDEIYYAISEEKVILPFRIENLHPTGAMRLHLSSRHWLDAYQPSWQAHLNRMVESVSANLHQLQSIKLHKKKETVPQNKAFPRIWSGVIILLVIVLSVLGTLWVVNRDKPAEFNPTFEISELQPSSTSENTSTLEPIPTEIPNTPEPTTLVLTETPVPEERLVVLHGYFNDFDFSLDPQVDANVYMRTIPDNLFLSLTGYDFERGEIVPEAAENWTVSTDGTLYTFKLRTDIPWVVHPIGGETVQVMDDSGQPRFLTAQDFVYAMRRICDPQVDNNSRRDTFIELVQGCREVNEYEGPGEIPEELKENIGIRAVKEDELLINLTHPSGYFLTGTSSTLFAAVPSWAIERYGPAWTNPGNIPTTGYFVIDSYIAGTSMRWLRNTLLPQDADGSGNVDVIEFKMALDNESAYELWLEKELDYCNLPDDNISHRTQYPNLTSQMFEPLVSTVFFQTRRAPFNNVHVRRAFAAALDRDVYREAFNSPAILMRHLAPPGTFGAPPVDEVGVGFDLDFARAELELAGYPDCVGFPTVSVVSSGKFFTEELMRDWEKNLGCPAGTIRLYSAGENIDTVHMYRSALVGDYPDEHNWVGKLHCDSTYANVDRACTEIDLLITQAAEETNPDKRIALYRPIEEAFFGYEGEFPVFPIIVKIFYTAEQPWVNRTQSFMFGETFYNWVIDMDAKLAAKELE